MIHFSAIIHHTGVSLTHKALRHWGFDHSATCEIAARNLWCTIFCVYFVICGVQWQVPLLQHALLGYIASDVALMLRMPQFNTMENWMHHILTTILVLYSIVEKTLHYDLIQLGGIGELSTAFLSVADTFKHIPWLQKRYSRVNQAFRALFIVSFVILRVFWWSYVILVATKTPPSIIFFCAFYGILMMQYYWFFLILRWCCKKIEVR